MHTIKLLKHSKTRDWQFELANAITCVDELLQWLELEHLKDDLVQDPTFRLLAPRAFVKKIRKRDCGDPLLRQILPLAAENSTSGFTDPVGDIDAMKTPGLLHKYKGRALLVTTGACAIHCRYCFRRHFPYASANPRKNEWRAMINYLECHDDIREIILSGGEPLILDNDRLEQLLGTLEQIEHLKWLRIHTRLPVVLPSRIDDGLLSLLQHLRFRTTLVVHSNHANELMADEMDVLHKLACAGVTLLNQSVLLKGVNDSATALIALSQRLHEAGVLPYYLHMLDPVQGASHFDIPQHTAVELINTIKTELPGFLVPRLVRETPGAASKSAIFTI